MKKNFMAEKCFRDIERRVQKEILLDEKKRIQYMERQGKEEYKEEASRLMRKGSYK